MTVYMLGRRLDYRGRYQSVSCLPIQRTEDGWLKEAVLALTEIHLRAFQCVLGHAHIISNLEVRMLVMLL